MKTPSSLSVKVVGRLAQNSVVSAANLRLFESEEL